MRRAIVVHGLYSHERYYDADTPTWSNFHRFPWLQKQLMVRDWEAHTPEMFHAHDPDYGLWCRELERFEIDTDTVLVGHSAGGGFLLRWLSEHPDVSIYKLVLVAPWVDRVGRLSPENMFLDFEIDGGLSQRVLSGIHLLESTNDREDVQIAIAHIKSACSGIHVYTFEDCGHFCLRDLGGPSFSDLLPIVLGDSV